MQEIKIVQSGADVVIQRHPDVSGTENISLPGIIHDYSGSEQLGGRLLSQFPHQSPSALRHPAGISAQKGADLRLGHSGGLLAAQAVDLAFFLQVNQGEIAVIVPQAELFPPVDAIQLFTQSPVSGRFKIEAPNAVNSIFPMGVRPGRRPETGPEPRKVAGGNLMLPLAAEFHIRFTSFPFCASGAVKRVYPPSLK